MVLHQPERATLLSPDKEAGHTGAQTSPGETKGFLPAGSVPASAQMYLFVSTFFSTMGCEEGGGRFSDSLAVGEGIWSQLLVTEMAFHRHRKSPEVKAPVLLASFCFFGDSNKTVLQMQSQKTSELDNDEWGTDVSGPSEWQLPPRHTGSMTRREGHCPALQATQSRPCHHSPSPRACGTHGEASPNGRGSLGLEQPWE